MSTLGSAVQAAASALHAERMRIEVAVSNLANAESTRGPDGQPYRRRDVILEVDARRPSTTPWAAPARPASRSPPSSRTRRRRAAATSRRIPMPTPKGYVSLPNVDPAEEMVDMLGAARAYQANLTAIGLIRDLVPARARARKELTLMAIDEALRIRHAHAVARAGRAIGATTEARPPASATRSNRLVQSVETLGRRGQHRRRRRWSRARPTCTTR